MEYVAIPPNQAIENIKKQHKQELEEKLGKLDGFKDSEAVAELEELYDQGLDLVEPAEMSGSLKGKHQIEQHVGTMFQEAEDSIKILTSEEGLKDLRDNHYNLLKEAKEQGVNVKLLAPVTEENADVVDDIREFAEVRHLEDKDEFEIPNGRFAVVDNDALTMSMTHDEVHNTQETAFWSKSDHMAEETLSPMFDVLWHHSEEPERPKGPKKPE